MVDCVGTDMPLASLRDDSNGTCRAAVISTTGDNCDDEQSHTFLPFWPVEGVIGVITEDSQ